MTESDNTAEIRQKAIEQKGKNKKRIREIRDQIRTQRLLPIPHPGDTRMALRLLTRERRTDRYRTMANKDSLTGLANKRFFNAVLPLELARVRRGKSLAIITGDLQELKKFNDSFGHDTGDRAIQAAATGMNQTLRDTDVAARFGGDEFAALLPDVSPQQIGINSAYPTEKDAAAAVALRINHAINEQSVSTSEQSPHQNVHVDIGIAIATKDDTPESILKRSDEASYRIKRINKQTNNERRSSIVVATIEDGVTVFDQATFGKDGHSIQFERLTSA